MENANPTMENANPNQNATQGAEAFDECPPLRPPRVSLSKDILERDNFQQQTGFRIQEVLGQGTFGTVFQGQRENGEIVAIKIDNNEQDIEGTAFNESKLLRHLAHQNILPVLHSGTYHNTEGKKLTYFCMPKCKTDLFNYLYISQQQQNEQHKTAQDLQFIVSLVCTVHALHAVDVMHTDIKPENILLRESDHGDQLELMLADFGDWQKTDQDGDLTDLAGTMPYMAKEVLINVCGGYARVSKSAERYTIGLVIYEIIVGEHLYDLLRVSNQEGNFELNLLQYMVERTHPIEIDRPFFTGVQTVLKTLLQHEPDERAQFDEILEALVTCVEEAMEGFDAEKNDGSTPFGLQPLLSRLKQALVEPETIGRLRLGPRLDRLA